MDKEKRQRLIIIVIISLAVTLLATIATLIGFLIGCKKDNNNNPSAYTVTFINGSENFDSRLVLSGDKATPPRNDPAKQNTAQFTYEFDGWYKNLNDATAFDFESSAITENITLYAKFTETINKYALSFVVEEKPYGEVQTIEYGNKATPPRNDPAKPNTAQFTYEFDGWYKNLDDATAFDFESSAITENITLYAKFTETDVLLNYSINADGNSCSVTGAKNNAVTDIRILEQYNGKPVKSIGEMAFYQNKNLKSIIIPDSVTSIDLGAFAECSGLTSVIIPDSVINIGIAAFTECVNLKNITIGKNVKIIGDGAFEKCSSLLSITIPDGVTTIGKSAFSYCSNLMSITIPDSVITLGESAFSYCSYLMDVIIGNGVTSINNHTFYNGTYLRSITIGENITQIGSYAFSECINLTSIIIPDRVISIAAEAFSNCARLANVTIGKGVTSIGTGAFKACSDLTITIAADNTAYKSAGNCLIETGTKTLIWGGKRSVIPTDGSVTKIGDAAFYECIGLKSITIPDSVTTIGTFAFCRNDLTRIIIGSGMTSISDSAFAGCDALRYITYYGTKDKWAIINKNNTALTDETYYTIDYVT